MLGAANLRTISTPHFTQLGITASSSIDLTCTSVSAQPLHSYSYDAISVTLSAPPLRGRLFGMDASHQLLPCALKAEDVAGLNAILHATQSLAWLIEAACLIEGIVSLIKRATPWAAFAVSGAHYFGWFGTAGWA
jgi:hypothetical protein